MEASRDRPEFAPPPEPALLRAFALAVLAHLLLVFALMHGLQWKREAQDAAVEAELWSALPQQAAPKPVPVPPPPPEPVVKAPPPPPPVVQAPPQPEPPAQREADIALEREKQKRLEEQHRRELELEKQRAEKAKLEKQREEAARLQAQKKREEELARKKEEQQKQLAEAKRKEEEKKRRQQEQELREAKLREQIRQDTLQRNLALAGTGAKDSPGTAARSSGPSGSWAGKVIARVRPNIVFTDDIPGNPEAVVEVRLAPDGTITSRKLKKSSGFKSYDEAVLRALDKTEVLPRDTDGTVPRGGDLVFRPKG